LLSLDGSKPGQLVLAHVDLLALLETGTVQSTRQEAGTVGVQRLVSGSSSPNAGVNVGVGDGGLSGLSLLQPGNDRVLEGELDKVHRQEPDDVPDPNDTDPSPETPRTRVKPQSPKAAMMEEINWARQKAKNKATEGRSMKKNPWDRVMKIKACEMIATCK